MRIGVNTLFLIPGEVGGSQTYCVETLKAMAEQFPEDADKIRSLIDYMVKMFSQVRKLKTNMQLKDKMVTPFIAPLVAL